MSSYNESAIAVRQYTLPLSTPRAYILEAMLIVATIILPVFAHVMHAPVRFLLPMHWPIIVAGLVYGWRGGALAGLLAPSVSYVISGFPLPTVLPSMTAELLVYGFIAGILREKGGRSAFVSVIIALILGRIVFIIFALITNSAVTNYPEYFRTALLPGFIAAALQIILLPFFAKWWVKQGQLKNQQVEKKVE